MPEVDSTAIRAIDYDARARTLFIRFIDDDLYAYFDVPEAIYAAFLAADSKGGFFADWIRTRCAFHKVSAQLSRD